MTLLIAKFNPDIFVIQDTNLYHDFIGTLLKPHHSSNMTTLTQILHLICVLSAVSAATYLISGETTGFMMNIMDNLTQCTKSSTVSYLVNFVPEYNNTEIQPQEYRSIETEGLDAVLWNCIQQLHIPYYAVTLIPNRQFADDTGMYDESDDSEDFTDTDRRSVEGHALEDFNGCKNANNPLMINGGQCKSSANAKYKSLNLDNLEPCGGVPWTTWPRHFSRDGNPHAGK